MKITTMKTNTIKAGALTMAFLLSATAYAQKSVFDDTVVEKENMEPAIPRPDQEKIAAAKLKELQAKQGKKPNVLEPVSEHASAS